MTQQTLTVQQHLLVKLMEECAEVVQAAAKALLFGIEHSGPKMESNLANLNFELSDVIGTIQACKDHGIELHMCPHAAHAKVGKIERYMEYSKELGTLHEKE
jgi:hypothetical protein